MAHYGLVEHNIMVFYCQPHFLFNPIWELPELKSNLLFFLTLLRVCSVSAHWLTLITQ